ncbi:phage shock protein PspA [Thalassotalea crassostreae]|uniref:phage shock protein PspA n=1 Tax=Thalassotalea crassostreae TaxID=1763536 RepID=UPI000837B1AA|nr:phage shock protein PspA [Thalassotalea crassostreae]
MGMFSRLTDIINANINSLLEKAENPEKLLRLIVQEMEETLVEVRAQAAKSIAEKKTFSRQQRNVDNQLNSWQQKAELALAKGREDLARSALVEKQKYVQQQQELAEQVAIIDEGLNSIQEDCQRLQDKLAEAKQRQKTFTMRQQSAVVRLKAKQQLDSGNIDNAIEKFERYQQKVDDLEAQVEAFDLTQKSSLESQFAELENDDLINEQLAQLKKKVVNG